MIKRFINAALMGFVLLLWLSAIYVFSRIFFVERSSVVVVAVFALVAFSLPLLVGVHVLQYYTIPLDRREPTLESELEGYRLRVARLTRLFGLIVCFVMLLGTFKDLSKKYPHAEQYMRETYDSPVTEDLIKAMPPILSEQYYIALEYYATEDEDIMAYCVKAMNNLKLRQRLILIAYMCVGWVWNLLGVRAGIINGGRDPAPQKHRGD